MFSKFYFLVGVAVLGFYGLAALTGWEYGTPERQKLPEEARRAPHGYRSPHFFIIPHGGGFFGGK